jgi:ligand-binding sensor domain-containing protein
MALLVVDPGAASSVEGPLETVIELKGQVFGIEEDTKGNIWFGTERGLQQYDGTTFRTFER